jgi:serine acetyltransferase
MKSQLLKTIASDAITLTFCVGPMVISVLLTLFIAGYLPVLWLQVVLFPIVLVLCFIFVIFVFRLLLPRLEKGVYPVGFNKGFMAWHTHSMLTRSARAFGIHYLIHSISFFRWLYWSALGAKVSYAMSTSYKITVHDVALLEIEEGVILAEDVEISGHVVRGDRVLVAPVKIGKNSFIGRGTYVGPRTRIGANCWIGMNNFVMGEVLPEGTKVQSHEMAQGHSKNPSQDNREKS